VPLIVIFLLFSCQFRPVYLSDNTKNVLCSIKVENEKKSVPLYEMNYKNELKSILCTNELEETNFLLKWSIKKRYRELIKSESNTIKRYEATLIVDFVIYDISSDIIVYSDTVESKGAYNILEDEIISTLASQKSIDSQIAIIAARLTLDKIHLFLLKDENSKL
jgi:hypothetical protein